MTRLESRRAYYRLTNPLCDFWVIMEEVTLGRYNLLHGKYELDLIDILIIKFIVS